MYFYGHKIIMFILCEIIQTFNNKYTKETLTIWR